MTETTKRDRPEEESEPYVGWSLRGRTYVPVTPTPASRPAGLDVDRANSMTDEGGPVPLPDEPGAPSTMEASRPTIWRWDLASGRVEWDEALKAHFGHADRVTDAAWRDDRIHPDDRARAQASLLRATIASQGGVWSDRHRFRRADGSYATVTERAYVVHDDAGPRLVVGALMPASPVGEATPSKTEEVL